MRHHFTRPERFVAGTVGQPGERAFFIQIRSGSRIFSVALEKSQVQAIASRIEIMVAEIRKSSPLLMIEKMPPDDAPLDSPIDSEFEVGAMSLAWNDESQLICLELFELEDDEEESE